MLRAYALSPKILRGELSTPSDQAALVRVLDAISYRVTLVLPRSDVQRLVETLAVLPLGLAGERLSEVITQELTSCGPGVFALSGYSLVQDCGKAMRAVASHMRVSGILLARGESPPDRLPADCNAIAIEQAAEDLSRERVEVDLRRMQDEPSLLAKLRDFFLTDGDLAIIDPYITAETLRSQVEASESQIGLAMLVKVAAQEAAPRRGVVRVRVIGSESRLRQELKRLARSTPRQAQLDTVAAKQVVDQRIRGIVTQATAELGRTAGVADVRIIWTKDILDRGIVSSKRCWKIEHSLRDLGLLVAVLRGDRQWPRSDQPVLKILRDDHAVMLRSLAGL